MNRLTDDSAFLFPGPGGSLAGAATLVATHCADLADQARAAVADDLLDRADESPRFAQPADFLASLAGWRSLDAPRPLAFAGHAAGELAALAAAGALDEHDALELVVLRGALMAEAAERARDGGMLALLDGTAAQAERLAADHGVSIAYDDAPGRRVLAGRASRLQEVAIEARALGMRAVVLDVAGAFHSPDMAGACPRFRRALGQATVRPARAPVISGLTARPFDDVRGQLAAALTRPVRWRQTLATLHAAGARTFVDVGPGGLLAGLVASTLPDSSAITIEELHGVHA